MRASVMLGSQIRNICLNGNFSITCPGAADGRGGGRDPRDVTACTPKPNGPEPTAEQFFAALATGDTAAAAELSDRPADARHALNDAWAGLQATSSTRRS